MADAQKKLNNLASQRKQLATKAAFVEQQVLKDPSVQPTLDELNDRIRVLSKQIEIEQKGIEEQAKKAAKAENTGENSNADGATNSDADKKDYRTDEISDADVEPDDELVTNVKDAARKAEGAYSSPSKAPFVPTTVVGKGLAATVDKTEQLSNASTGKKISYGAVALGMSAVTGAVASHLCGLGCARAAVTAGTTFAMGAKGAIKETYQAYQELKSKQVDEFLDADGNKQSKLKAYLKVGMPLAKLSAKSVVMGGLSSVGVEATMAASLAISARQAQLNARANPDTSFVKEFGKSLAMTGAAIAVGSASAELVGINADNAIANSFSDAMGSAKDFIADFEMPSLVSDAAASTDVTITDDIGGDSPVGGEEQSTETLPTPSAPAMDAANHTADTPAAEEVFVAQPNDSALNTQFEGKYENLTLEEYQTAKEAFIEKAIGQCTDKNGGFNAKLFDSFMNSDVMSGIIDGKMDAGSMENLTETINKEFSVGSNNPTAEIPAEARTQAAAAFDEMVGNQVDSIDMKGDLMHHFDPNGKTTADQIVTPSEHRANNPAPAPAPLSVQADTPVSVPVSSNNGYVGRYAELPPAEIEAAREAFIQKAAQVYPNPDTMVESFTGDKLISDIDSKVPVNGKVDLVKIINEIPSSNTVPAEIDPMTREIAASEFDQMLKGDMEDRGAHVTQAKPVVQTTAPASQPVPQPTADTAKLGGNNTPAQNMEQFHKDLGIHKVDNTPQAQTTIPAPQPVTPETLVTQSAADMAKDLGGVQMADDNPVGIVADASDMAKDVGGVVDNNDAPGIINVSPQYVDDYLSGVEPAELLTAANNPDRFQVAAFANANQGKA